MDCPRCARAHRKRCQTRCFDSTMFHIVHGTICRDLPHILNKKNAPLSRCVILFKMVVGDGFEPSKAEPADLQSAPFSHSGIPPYLERVTGVEPVLPAWKAGAQPLCHTRDTLICQVEKWYRRWELNPQSSRNTDLNRARLPIPPRRQLDLFEQPCLFFKTVL